MFWHILQGLAVCIGILLLAGFVIFLRIRALYFGPNAGYHRRMPHWLIIVILIWFMLFPRIDRAYAESRDDDKMAQYS